MGQDGFLKVIDTKETQVLKSFKICDFCLSTLVAIKTDEIFAVHPLCHAHMQIGSWDSKVHVFNINYGSKVQVVDKFNDAVSALVYLRKRRLLVTGSWDCSLKFFACSETSIDESSEETIQDYDAQITTVAASEDETLVAVGDVDGKVHLLATDGWHQKAKFELNNEKVVKVQFFRTNLLVAGDNIIKLFDAIGGNHHIIYNFISGNLLTSFKVDKYNGAITDFLVDKEKYLVACNFSRLISHFRYQKGLRCHLLNAARKEARLPLHRFRPAT